MKIFMTKKEYELKTKTKTVFILVGEETREITKEEYENITNDDTLSFFRRLGGSEYAERTYTKYGYFITRLISKSPDRETKIVRTFKFI